MPIQRLPTKLKKKLIELKLEMDVQKIILTLKRRRFVYPKLSEYLLGRLKLDLETLKQARWIERRAYPLHKAIVSGTKPYRQPIYI